VSAPATHATYRLVFPLRLASAKGEIVTELTLRRVKGKDLKAVEPLSPQATVLKLIERLSTPSVSQDEIDEMDQLDIHGLDRVIEGFSKSGKPPSQDAVSTS
jgi:hypothetical protein